MKPLRFDPEMAARLADPSPAGDVDHALARINKAVAKLPPPEPPPTPADVARLNKLLSIGRRQ